MWFNHHMQGYTAARRAGTAGVVAGTSEPSSIHSCLHLQHAQRTGDLCPLSTSGIKASLLYRSRPSLFQEKSEVSYPSLIHHHLYNQALPGERRALPSSLAPNWKAIEPGYGTSQEMRSSPGLQIRTGQTDRHKSDPERCSPSLLHTQRPEHLLDRPHRQRRWGMIPIPLKQGQGSVAV